MQDRLFQEPISIFMEQRIYEAKTRAENLTEQQLDGPDLGETLARITSFKFDVAVMNPDERRGKRRTEKRNVMDYGREVIVDVDFIDVTIPFEGSPKSFHIAPSSCAIISEPASISNNAVQVSFLDDQNLDRNVDLFIQRVTENLVTLKNELQRIEHQMLQTAQLTANQRIQQIRDRRARDKARSFPIE